MSVIDQLQQLIHDPPPSYLFEISELGIAVANIEGAPRINFEPLPAGILEISPLADNVRNADALTRAVQKLAPLNGRRNHPCALILPDFAARVSVLDFDSLPRDESEQLSLVRFRLKKTLPFDIDSAMVSYFVQPNPDKGRVDVVAAVMSLEIVARYEAVFRAAGFHPGSITTSALSMLNLYREPGTSVIAKKCGRTLTIGVMRSGVLKLIRCLVLERPDEPGEVLAALFPTLAYVEDQLGASADRLAHCGFGPAGLQPVVAGLEVTSISSRYGAPGEANAGLLGYLEGIGA
jgi:type IV pilus assembly protein PilM